MVVVVALVAFKLLMEGWSARKDLSAVKGRKPHDELTPFTACLPAKEGPPTRSSRTKICQRQRQENLITEFRASGKPVVNEASAIRCASSPPSLSGVAVCSRCWLIDALGEWGGGQSDITCVHVQSVQYILYD